MFERITIKNLQNETLIPLDSFSVSQALATLLGFLASGEAVETYRVDYGSLTALRRAACSVTNTPKDAKRQVVQYSVKSAKTGRDTWKPLRKDAKPPEGSKTRTIETLGYSSDQLKVGVKALRDLHNVELSRLADRTPIERDDATYRVALSRIEN